MKVLQFWMPLWCQPSMMRHPTSWEIRVYNYFASPCTYPSPWQAGLTSQFSSTTAMFFWSSSFSFQCCILWNPTSRILGVSSTSTPCWCWTWIHPHHQYSLSPHDSFFLTIHIYPTCSALLYCYCGVCIWTACRRQSQTFSSTQYQYCGFPSRLSDIVVSLRLWLSSTSGSDTYMSIRGGHSYQEVRGGAHVQNVKLWGWGRGSA